MDDEPLLPRVKDLREGAIHDATSSQTSSLQEGEEHGEGKAKDAAAQSCSSEGSEKPKEADIAELNNRSGQIPAAVGGNQDAVPKRKFFPSPRFPFSFNKTPAARRGSGETPLDRDCAGLIERLDQLGRWSGSSSVISAPTARLIEATRSVALMDGVNSKERREAQFEMLLASASLTMVASREKLEEEIATTAKDLASEAAALLAKAGGLDQPNERSNDFLFCITISGALALLPYLPTQIPDPLRLYVCIVFGLVFYAASVGAVLSFKATNRSQLKAADVLNTVSFGGFSLLVVAFICSALASGSIILVCICALVLVVFHFYAWSRT